MDFNRCKQPSYKRRNFGPEIRNFGHRLGDIGAPAHPLDLARLEGASQKRPRGLPRGDGVKVARRERLMRCYVLFELHTDEV